jgi:ribosomal protein L37E
VGSIDSRLRRLEERDRDECAECGLSSDGRGYIVLIDEENPEKSFQGNSVERCGRCGRHLYTVIEVVYGDDRGGGLT